MVSFFGHGVVAAGGIPQDPIVLDSDDDEDDEASEPTAAVAGQRRPRDDGDDGADGDDDNVQGSDASTEDGAAESRKRANVASGAVDLDDE